MAGEFAVSCGRKIGPFDCCSVVEGDCLELMKQLPDGCVDAVITDPPYGVQSPDARFPRAYDTYEDTLETFSQTVVPAITKATAIAKRCAVFCPPPASWMLPTPSAIGGVFIPAAVGKNRWGFMNFSPVVFYGSGCDMNLGSKATAILGSGVASSDGHPCAKPIQWMLWLVNLGSRVNDTILDPFTGSGTTLVAAKKLARHFLGFEISPEYCDIARQRIALVEAQPNLFAPKAEQLGLI